MSKTGSVSEDLNLNICAGCKIEVGVGEKAVQCDLCNNWVHNACGSMPDDLYKLLVKYEKKKTGVKWFCNACEIHMGKVRMEIKVISEKQVKVELRVDKIETNWMDIKREVTELKNELTDLVKEKQKTTEMMSVKMDDKMGELKEEIGEIKRSYSEMVQDNNRMGGEGTGLVSNAPARAIKIEVNEVMEREKRKNNLVIFGIDETNDEMATRAKVSTIVNALGLEDSKIKYFGRVGRLVPGVSARARIVRVVCEDAETKRNCLKAANRLKTMEGYANIYMALDLTKVQQMQDKELREKLKEIRDVHKEAKINNGDIVIFEQNNRRVLYSLNQ